MSGDPSELLDGKQRLLDDRQRRSSADSTEQKDEALPSLSTCLTTLASGAMAALSSPTTPSTSTTTISTAARGDTRPLVLGIFARPAQEDPIGAGKRRRSPPSGSTESVGGVYRKVDTQAQGLPLLTTSTPIVQDPTFQMLQDLSHRLDEFSQSEFAQIDAPSGSDAPHVGEVGEANPPEYQSSSSGDEMEMGQVDAWYSNVDEKLAQFEKSMQGVDSRFDAQKIEILAKVERVMHQENEVLHRKFDTLHAEVHSGFLKAISALEGAKDQAALARIAQEALDQVRLANETVEKNIQAQIGNFNNNLKAELQGFIAEEIEKIKKHELASRRATHDTIVMAIKKFYENVSDLMKKMNLEKVEANGRLQKKIDDVEKNLEDFKRQVISEFGAAKAHVDNVSAITTKIGNLALSHKLAAPPTPSAMPTPMEVDKTPKSGVPPHVNVGGVPHCHPGLPIPTPIPTLIPTPPNPPVQPSFGMVAGQFLPVPPPIYQHPTSTGNWASGSSAQPSLVATISAAGGGTQNTQGGSFVSANPYMGMANSILTTTHQPPEQFSGQKADWPDWKRRWDTHVGVLSSGGGTLPDAFLASRLESVLDPPSREELRGMLEAGASYQKIWEHFCTFFGEDSEETSRAAWEGLQLVYRGKISSSEWRSFSAKFLTHMKRTPGASEGEGLRLLRRQLPNVFGEKLEAERAKRGRSGPRHLLVSGFAPHVTDAQCFAWVSSISGHDPIWVTKECGKFAVECHNQGQVDLLKSLDGQKMADGNVLKVITKDPPLDTKTAIELVSQWILQKERVEEAKKLAPRGRDFEKKERSARVVEEHRSPTPQRPQNVAQNAQKSATPPTSPRKSSSSSTGKGRGKGRGGGGWFGKKDWSGSGLSQGGGSGNVKSPQPQAPPQPNKQNVPKGGGGVGPPKGGQ